MGKNKNHKTLQRHRKKNCFFNSSSLYLLVHFQRLRPHFVSFPFHYCLTLGVESQQLPHMSPSNSKECSMHSLCLQHFPWLQWELEDLHKLQSWSWRMIYASYIYFPVVFVYLETFTGLDGRSVHAHGSVNVCVPQDDRLMAESCSLRHGKNA